MYTIMLAYYTAWFEIYILEFKCVFIENNKILSRENFIFNSIFMF